MYKFITFVGHIFKLKIIKMKNLVLVLALVFSVIVAGAQNEKKLTDLKLHF